VDLVAVLAEHDLHDGVDHLLVVDDEDAAVGRS